MSLILLFLVTFTQAYTGMSIGSGGSVSTPKVQTICTDKNTVNCVAGKVENVSTK
jgi:hypothetical protein